MKIGDRVEIRSSWSSFKGRRATVSQTRPFLMVVLDDDPRALRIEESSVVPVQESGHMVAGE